MQRIGETSAAQLRAMIGSSVDGVLVVDRDGHVRFANDAACRLLGRSAEQLLGSPLGYPLVDQGPVEIAIATPAGHVETYVELRGASIEWEGEHAVLANVRDVTEYRQRERRLGRLNTVLDAVNAISRALLHDEQLDKRQLLEHVCDVLRSDGGYDHMAVLLWDDDGVVESVYESPTTRCAAACSEGARCTDLPCAARACQHSEGVVLDRCELCPAPDDALRLLVVPLADGQRTFGCVNAATSCSDALLDDERRLLAALAADIGRALSLADSRRAHADAQRALEGSERLLLETGRMARVGGWQMDRARHIERTAVVREIVQMPSNLNPSYDEVLEHFVGDGRAQFDEAVDRAFAEATPFSLIAQIHSYDGEDRWLDLRGEPVVENGEVVMLRGMLQDVTEREQLAQQLHHAQRLEAMGRLAGGVAHDFNNLLTAIFSFGGFVLDELDPASGVRDDMEEVLKAARRAEFLTRQLLAFSRRRTVKPQLIDVNDHIRELDKMLRRLVGEHISCTLDLAGQSPTVHIDPGALQTIIINLVANARDAMPDGGELSISTRDIELAARQERDLPPGRYCEIVVADTGTGMDSATQEHVFEPFFTTKEVGHGTGLGLSTCYGLARQADGGITIDSALGRGTRMRVLLPHGQRAAQRTRRDRSTTQVGREVVVLVEDDPAIRRACGRVLGDLGYTIIAARDAEQTLQLLESCDQEPALLVADVVLPKMSGKQLADVLRQRLPELRVLFMSGYTEDALGPRGELPRDVDLLPKPFTPQDLARRVRLALDAD